MALAPVVYTIYSEHLRYDPDDPTWENRDRFVLSVGHASNLLYGMLHLSGVKSVDPSTGPVGEPAMTVDDIRGYRSGTTRATGHPEYTAWSPALKHRPARLGKDSQTPSVWR